MILMDEASPDIIFMQVIPVFYLVGTNYWRFRFKMNFWSFQI